MVSSAVRQAMGVTSHLQRKHRGNIPRSIPAPGSYLPFSVEVIKAGLGQPAAGSGWIWAVQSHQTLYGIMPARSDGAFGGAPYIHSAYTSSGFSGATHRCTSSSVADVMM
jgi:hypothetical protein